MSGVAQTSIDAFRAHTVRDLSEGQRRVMAAIRVTCGLDFTRAEKAAWVAANPGATPQQYEAALEAIAKRLGL